MGIASVYSFVLMKKKKEKEPVPASAFFLFPTTAPERTEHTAMIRAFAKLCKTLFENICDEAIFDEMTDSFTRYDKACPKCGATGKLSPFGDYTRGLISFMGGKPNDSRIKPQRFKCKSCKGSHALLPDILIPYSPYSLRFRLAVLAAYFERGSTVVEICERYGIAVSTLYEWKGRFLEHKELMLGVLASQKEPALAFLRSLLDSDSLSGRLKEFFAHHGFSFLQNRSTAAADSRPP
jgi:transposase-like protein